MIDQQAERCTEHGYFRGGIVRVGHEPSSKIPEEGPGSFITGFPE